MPDRTASQRGFSLAELLVAMLFTMILMAGMATVFKASLSSFMVSGESMSSTRRNRLAMDLLSDDLNLAGQYLTLNAPPNGIVDTNPGFVINPNVAFTDTDIPAADAVGDELLFYFDDPIPFEGTFDADVLGTSSYVASGAAAPIGTSFDIKFKSNDEAKNVKAGMMLVTRGNYEYKKILTASDNGPKATITIDGVFGDKHLGTEGVVIAKPAQYIRYRIESRNWDPEKPTGVGIPCLIREQGAYPGSAAFAPDPALTTIVAENVSRFSVSLSADRGVTWTSGTSWNAIKTSLNAQLSASGAPGFTSIDGNPHWYRSVPVLVRLDVTTRTARARSEFSATGNALAYKEHTQSLVLLPRHFGLNF
jgi:type II secretory pathway pseudopilin PulG